MTLRHTAPYCRRMSLDHNLGEEADLMTPSQVRERLGISLRTYQRYVASGLLVPAYRPPGGWRRFSRSHVEAVRSTVADPNTAGSATA